METGWENKKLWAKKAKKRVVNFTGENKFRMRILGKQKTKTENYSIYSEKIWGRSGHWASDTICLPFICARLFLLFSTRVFVFHGLALRPPCR